MNELRLKLLNRPRVTINDSPLTHWALQSLALLAYLTVTGCSHSRAALAGMLWPDCSETNARSSLRKVLAELRQRVPAHLAITRGYVAFDITSDYWLDVEAFEQDIDRALARGYSLKITFHGGEPLVPGVEFYRLATAAATGKPGLAFCSSYHKLYYLPPTG